MIWLASQTTRRDVSRFTDRNIGVHVHGACCTVHIDASGFPCIIGIGITKPEIKHIPGAEMNVLYPRAHSSNRPVLSKVSAFGEHEYGRTGCRTASRRPGMHTWHVHYRSFRSPEWREASRRGCCKWRVSTGCSGQGADRDRLGEEESMVREFGRLHAHCQRL